MKLTKYYLSVLSVALLMSSCAKEMIMENPVDPNQIPINITGSIYQQHTKATADGFVDKDAVGLYAVNYTEGNTVAGTLQVSGNQADNVKYVFDESAHKWVPVKGVYYKDVNTNVDIYLYYPYQASISNMTAGVFEVNKDQSSVKTETNLGGYEASDFLWGKKAGVTPSESNVSVQLSHKMSAVNLKLKEGTGFASEEFEGLEKNVILVNTTRKATVDYTTGEVTKVGSPQLDGIVMCPQSDGSFRAIVVPQSVEANTNLFAITIDGVTYGFQHTDAIDYLAGKQLDVTVEISKKSPSGEYQFSLTDTQITDWTEDKNTHGGEARQYFVVNVTEPGTLGATIKAMGKNPDKIRNLKVVGNVRDDDFYFMRDSMAILEAINMKESKVAAPKESKYLTSYVDKTSNNYKSICYALGEPDEIYDNYAHWYDKGNGIPREAFNGKKSLRFISFPEELSYIGEAAFKSTMLSNNLVLPDSITYIGAHCFESTLISGLSLPINLVYLGDLAFANCSSCSGTLNLPASFVYIGRNAFQGCNFNGNLILPDNLEYIGGQAFEGNRFTGSLRIPDKIKKIENYVFNNCTSFNGTLDLNNVQEIGDCAFYDSKFSGELILPDGLINISSHAFNYNNFSSVKFPESLAKIGGSAFAYNSRLCCDIVIPEGCTSIEGSAFKYCKNITGLVLPSTMATIGTNAFADCHNISHITCNGTEPPTLLSGAFIGVAKDNFTVEVPAQSVKRYQAESGWSDFKRISAHYDFSVSREKMRALNAEQIRVYTLRAPANFKWNIKSKPDWVTVSPESGTGKTDITITVKQMERTSTTFAVNEGTYNNPNYQNYKGRSDEIVFQLDEEGVDYTCSMEIEQYDSDYSDSGVITYQTHTTGNGIDIIFVGDGYDAKDIAKGTFFDNAKEGYENFFNVEPYKTYKEYFNVYAVVSQSDDSGIGTVNTVKDSKFGTYFTQNRIKVPESEPIFTWAKKADNEVDFTKALVINLLNTSAYEGICAMYGDGSAIAFCPVSRDAYPYDFRGIIQHEAGGHGFGKLGDEYIYHNAFIQNCDCKDGCDHPVGDNDTQSSYGRFKSLGWYKNLSMNGDMHQVPWSHLIYNPKYSNYVDMYEGGYMHSRGVYRSEATSCMNNNIPYYSAISRQAIVERILDISGEGFTLKKFYDNDSDAFGSQTKAGWAMPFDRTFGVDPKWNRGSEEGSVIYMGEHPDYSKIK